ncbi:MAG TPA: diguanylate cyclase, partial [Alphaproteobacteria bacterium]|nr:diguanylate cyclase [Alphaproteobacteria bacterium]
MSFSGFRASELRAALFKPTSFPAIIAVLVIALAGAYADYQNNLVHRQRLRAGVLSEMSLVRAKLEGNITANLQLVRGMVAAISAEPDISPEHFARLAANIFEEDSQLRNIAVAPDLVVTMTYPLQGNEGVIGLDYRANRRQQPAAMRAVETGQLVVAGPVDLVQGGRGFIARFPVYVGDVPAARRLWGLVSAVIDIDRLYRDSGLLDPDLGIEIAIAGTDGTGAAGEQFFGRPEVFLDDPVTAEVMLPSGSWIIAAVPKEGWNTTPPGAWLLRGVIVVLGALVVFPIIFGGRLIEERQRNIRELGAREAELQKLSRRLSLALETSRIGVWEYDVETKEVVWDDRMNEIYGLAPDGGRRSYADWRDRLHPDDLDRAIEDFRIAAEVTGQYHSEYRIVTPGGETRSVRAIGRLYKDPGHSAKMVGVNWDVTTDVALSENLKRAHRLAEARNAELEAAKARIEHNALHDSLTGLPNRRYLDDILKRHAARCALNGRQLALLHIDLDRFKQINDTLGHAAGDAMLVHASQVLTSNVRSEDFVARIGGDEFVVVCSGDGDEKELATLAERIVATMRQPVAYQGHECRFGVSIGIAAEAGAEVDPKRLLINADIAL